MKQYQKQYTEGVAHVLLRVGLAGTVYLHRIWPHIYTAYDRILGDFPAKNTVDTPDIYGSGQPLLCVLLQCTDLGRWWASNSFRALESAFDIKLFRLPWQWREVPPKKVCFSAWRWRERERCPQETVGFSDCLTEERGASKENLFFQLDRGERREVPPRNSWLSSLTMERGERGLQETVGFSAWQWREVP